MRTAGRRSERDKIARISAAVHESSVVFVGDTGIGKTHLLEAVQAESAIDAVLLRINPAESGWPLSGFSAMLSSINDSRAVEFGGRFVLRSTDPEHMFAAARDLLILIRGLTLPPMLLLVDDIDLMDHESQVLVGFIAGRLGGTGIRFIATASHVDPVGPFGGLQQELLGPLSPADALQLLHEIARPPVDEGTLPIVVSQSGGNPRALIENLGDLTPEQLAGDHPMLMPLVPGPTARAVATRALQHLGRAPRAMLDRLSTAPLSLQAVATAGGMNEEDALHDLVFAGLVEVRGRFVTIRSPLLRSQLYWSMSGRSRREHHATAAEAYRGLDDRLALWHTSFCEGETVPARSIMAAAVWFAREGHVAAAIEFAESARRQGDDVAETLSDLAEALFLRGELALAARYVEAGLGVAHASLANLRLALLRLKVEFMRTQRVPGFDFDGLVAAYSPGHPRMLGELLTAASLCIALRWEVEPAKALLDRASSIVPPGSRSILRFQDVALQLVEATEAAPRRAIHPVVPQRSPQGRVVNLLVAGRAAALREDYSEARWIFSLVFGQRPNPEPIWMDSARYLFADNEVRAGHFTSARAAIAEWHASRIIRSTHSSHTYLDAWLAYAEGRTADSHEQLAERLAHSPHDDNPGLAASLLTLKGELCLIDGDVDEATRLLSLAELVGGRFGNPALVRYDADHVEAAANAGHVQQATAALREFESRAARHPSRWAELGLARARAVLTEDDGLALAMFDHAVAACAPTDSGLEVGRLHLAHAARLENIGMLTEARGALAAARSAFDSAGATPWLQRVDAALGPEQGADRSVLFHHLTEEELRIVQLVQQGLRNKEIASRLYISVRTVELRLTHIYRKVGARSRSHLVSLMS